jgi:hypothetical protein
MGIYMSGDIYGIYMCGGESERGPPLRLCGVYVAMWGCIGTCNYGGRIDCKKRKR